MDGGEYLAKSPTVLDFISKLLVWSLDPTKEKTQETGSAEYMGLELHL